MPRPGAAVPVPTVAVERRVAKQHTQNRLRRSPVDPPPPLRYSSKIVDVSDDSDLVSRVQQLVRLFKTAHSSSSSRGGGGPGDDEDDADFWSQRTGDVLAQITRSLEHWPALAHPGELIANLTRIHNLVTRASATSNLLLEAGGGVNPCDYVVIAILGGEIYVDVSQYGRGRPCGLAPSEQVSQSLDFLAAFARSPFGGGGETFSDVAFVLCVDDRGPVLDEVPSLAYAKLKGHAQPGILVPGPAHASGELYPRKKGGRRGTGRRESTADAVAAWPERHAQLRAAAATTFGRKIAFRDTKDERRVVADASWSRRHSRAVWRGRVDQNFACSERGSWSRIEAVALTLAYPTLFDARFTRRLNAATSSACVARAMESENYVRYLRRLIGKDVGTARSTMHLLATYMSYRFVLMLPESRGCRDATATSTWGLGAAVIIWDSACVEWYDPATSSGDTHVTVNLNTAKHILSLLVQHDSVARYLAKRATELYEKLLCPACAARHWAETIRRYRAHLGFEALPRRTDLEELLAAHGLELIKHAATESSWLGIFNNATNLY